MKPSEVEASWDPGQDNSLVSRDIYDHARGSMYVCAYEGEWLWWSPARTRVKKKSKAGGCIHEEGTWKGDEMGHGGKGVNIVGLGYCCVVRL